MLDRASGKPGTDPDTVCSLVSRREPKSGEAAFGAVVPMRGSLAQTSSAPPGIVYLVGAGPGSADLVTVRAARLLAEADVVVYDRLIGPEVLTLVRGDAERIFVGKTRSRHTLSQPEISALLVRLARVHRSVVRLKGGDPFIFGRGGEEIETLVAHGVPFEVVPGVTAAAGIAAYAGIPLTHRDHSHAVVLVTGHLKDGTMNLDWPALARPGQTLVVYMGLLGLPVLVHQLMAHGLPADTPAAVVSHGTLPTQRVLAGTLAQLPALAFDARLEPPTLIIVGDVVRLRSQLAWFDPAATAKAKLDSSAA